jgi:hypothetical protein
VISSEAPGARLKLKEVRELEQNAMSHFSVTQQRFSKRVIAHWLAGKLLKTKGGAVRLALDGLGTVGSLLG